MAGNEVNAKIVEEKEFVNMAGNEVNAKIVKNAHMTNVHVIVCCVHQKTLLQY